MLRPRLLMFCALLGLVILTGATCVSSKHSHALGGSSAGMTPRSDALAPQGPDAPLPGPVQDVFEALNRWRQTPLIWDPILAGVAQAHVNDMSTYHFYALVNPYTSVDMPTRAASSGAAFALFGQGISRGYLDGMDLFLDMPSASLAVSGSFSRIGIAHSPARGGLWAYILTR